MVEDLVPDSLWERVAPLLPARAPRRRRFPGRLPVDDRVALAGIVYVLRTGITWNQLPAAMLGCSGVTCWRRVRDWTEAGVWPALHELRHGGAARRLARPSGGASAGTGGLAGRGRRGGDREGDPVVTMP